MADPTCGVAVPTCGVAVPTCDEDKEYDAAKESETFDKKRGNLHWVGRRICKVFGSQGAFEGIVFATDDDSQRNGYRLFRVHYFEDPDDGESMWAEELIQ